MTRDEIKALHKSTAVSADFLAEIGRITAHFALLERDLIMLVHSLLDLHESVALTITSELSFRGLQQLASSLVKEMIPTEVNNLKIILQRVGKAEEKRNRVSHSLWGAAATMADEEQRVVRTKYSAKQNRGLHFSREELTVRDLHKMAVEISIAAYDVAAFTARIVRARKEGEFSTPYSATSAQYL
ncbi:hypothetical protein [Achromobacter denitrificans]|uniref:hypothetical protein n=1 Tax=Achromobacter denitrificans TaxID=32002 RepID=UPI0023E874C3|nr:hypothetical protein [Achromobacter denitrificans]MDF3847555.1 hypothetical protein [Achromobacter denitrificans]